jgi:hypothetical protein
MRAVASILLLLLIAACKPDGEAAREAMVAPILTSEEARDPWTFAQPETARVTHVALDLALDFETKRVGGTATLDILAKPGANTVVLDSDALEITSIAD